MSEKRETVLWLARHAETATPTLFHGAESDVELGEGTATGKPPRSSSGSRNANRRWLCRRR